MFLALPCLSTCFLFVSSASVTKTKTNLKSGNSNENLFNATWSKGKRVKGNITTLCDRIQVLFLGGFVDEISLKQFWQVTTR